MRRRSGWPSKTTPNMSKVSRSCQLAVRQTFVTVGTRASGTVTVRVTVDETGSVTSAKAVSGHPLLQAAAVAAARQAKFSPTLLSGKPVKVSGVLTYNFVLEQ